MLSSPHACVALSIECPRRSFSANPQVSATHDAQISITRAGHSTTVRLFDYLTPEMAEDAERAANVWIKSLRAVRFDGKSFREAFSYHGDSLWWFAELYLHKRRTINTALAAIRAFGGLVERERPERMAVSTGDRIVLAVARQLADRHQISMEPESAASDASWLARAGSSIVSGIHAWSPVVRRFRTSLHRPSASGTEGLDVVVFVHSAFWRGETGDDTYVGPLVDALRSHFGTRLRIVSVGPSTTFRARTWHRRLKELWEGGRGQGGAFSSAPPLSIEAYSSIAALEGSRRLWKERHVLADRLTSSEELRRSSVVEGVDLWDVLQEDFTGIAMLQAPWSARAMDEAAAALDALRPRVIVTYAEAGGWGRALVLEARRRGIRSVGLQHGFISRHWLNYLHEGDEVQPADVASEDRGFPFPAVTLLYDEFAQEHLRSHGRFPASALRIVGNPRLEALVDAARRLTEDDRRRARDAAGARSDQHIVLLAIKYRPAWNDTLRALADAIRGLPAVHLAIRPHPGDAPGSYDAMIAGVPNARVMPRTPDAVALMTAARLVVTINSTVAIEAMPLGIPALAMRLPNYLSPFVDAGAMAGTRTLTDIGPMIARLVEDGPDRSELLECARAFVERYRMVPDGRTAERTVAAVRELSEDV